MELDFHATGVAGNARKDHRVAPIMCLFDTLLSRFEVCFQFGPFPFDGCLGIHRVCRVHSAEGVYCYRV